MQLKATNQCGRCGFVCVNIAQHCLQQCLVSTQSTTPQASALRPLLSAPVTPPAALLQALLLQRDWYHDYDCLAGIMDAMA
jgi:hypothetical protein